jgi:F-type H+-transporting ATPase subunit gamma
MLMANLMTMRHRIKAVQTIKKITHAMRLISMSTHARMKHLETPVKTYQAHLNEMLNTALGMHSDYRHPLLQPSIPKDEHPLIIVISSQKGLCGSFNAGIFQLCNLAPQLNNAEFITVGKYATQFIQRTHASAIISSYHAVGLHNFHDIALNIASTITQAKKPFGSITIYSNNAKSFFVQKPTATVVVPATMHAATQEIEFYWEQQPEEVLTFLSEQYLRVQIQQALFQSLLAEHAARFVSMDSSTRNAQEILETMQIAYNKARQAKITRELTELSAFFIV